MTTAPKTKVVYTHYDPYDALAEHIAIQTDVNPYSIYCIYNHGDNVPKLPKNIMLVEKWAALRLFNFQKDNSLEEKLKGDKK